MRLFAEPAFRRADGGWEAVDPTVADGSGEASLAAEGAVLPTRFFADESRLIELQASGGALEMSATGLSITEPKIRGGWVVYSDVAEDTDLRYRVSADSLKEEIVLRSPSSPRSYTFHLSDPPGVLGGVDRDADGSWRFRGEVAPGVSLAVPPPVAYEEGRSNAPVEFDPDSASLDVRSVAGGYDITIEVDEHWLDDKSYPVVLDPTLTLTGSGGVALDGFAPNGSTGNFLINASDGRLYAGSSSQHAWRSYLRFNTEQIPYSSEVTDAELGLYNDACLAVDGVSGCLGSAYSVRVRRMTGAWGASSTSSSLAPLIDGSDLAALEGQADIIEGWQSFDVTGQVQRWVRGEQENHGLALRVVNEALGRSGPAWHASESQNGAARPYLQVTYSPNASNGYPPAGPGSSYAFDAGVAQTTGVVAPAPRRTIFEPLDHSLFGWYSFGSEERYAQWNLGGPTPPILPASGWNTFAGGAQDITGTGDSIWALGTLLTGSQETRWDYANTSWTRSGGALAGASVGSPALGRGALTTWRDARNGRIWAAYLQSVAEGTTTKTHLFTAQSNDDGATFGSAADLGAPVGSAVHSAQFAPLPSGGVGLLAHADDLRWYPSATGVTSSAVFTPTAPQTELTMSWQVAATDDGGVHLLVAAPGSPLNHYRLASGTWSVHTTVEAGYRDLSVSSFGEGLWLATNEVSQLRLRRFETESGAWDSGRTVAAGVAGRPSLPERSNRYHLPVLWNRPHASGPFLHASRFDDLGPIIEMRGPGDGSLLTGTVTVTAFPDDPGLGTAGVKRVDFFVDRGNGAVGYLGSDLTPDANGEFAYAWDTDASDGAGGKKWPAGAYRIYTVAWDLGGNRSESGRLTGYIDRKDLGLHAARPTHTATVGDVSATVNLVNGNLVLAQTDASHPTVLGPLTLTRTFNSQDLTERKAGPGWALSAELDVGLIFRELVHYGELQGLPSGTISLVEPDGTEHFYFTDGKGGYVPFIEDSSVLKANGDGSWTLVLLDGTRYDFGVDRRLARVTPGQSSQGSFAYTYNGAGELTSIAEPGGRAVTLGYTGGKVATIAEFDSSKTWTYAYTSGRLTRVTDPAGSFTQFGYDSAGRINQITDRGGSVLFVDYDATGRVAALRQRHIDGGGPVDYTTSIEYTNASTSKVIDLRGNLTGCDATCKTFYTTTHTFDAQRRTTTVARTLPDGTVATSTSGWDEPANLQGARRPRNLLTSTTDPLGRRTDHFFDEVGNRTKTIDPAGTTTHRYDEGYGGLVAEFYPNTSLTPSPGFPIRRLDATVDVDWGACSTAGVCSPHSSIPADNFSSRWTGWIDVPTSGSWIFSTEVDDGVRLYVDGNLLLDHWEPSATTRTAAPIVLQAGLHEISLQHFEAGGGARMRLRWKGPGVPTQIVPAGRLRPGLGLLTSATGPDGQVTTTAYDGPLTKLVVEESETNTDLDGTVTTLRTRYGYTDPSTGQPDAYGRRRTKTLPNGNTGAAPDPAFTTTYAYYGLTEAATNPCTGSSANQAGQLKSETPGTLGATSPITHVYDIRGNPVATTDGNGTACHGYDARSRRVSFKAADRATATSYAFTPDGMLDTVNDPVTGSSNYDYDDLDRLTAATDVFGGTTTHAYDTFTASTQTTTVTDPSGVRTATIDQAGRTARMTFTPVGGTAQAYSFTYDASGALDTATYPNGATVNRDYDPAGRLAALRNHTAAGTAVADYTMAYDAASRRTIEDGPHGRWRYGYDSVGRLERVHDPAGYTRRYRFDRNTNRVGLDTAAGLHWERGATPHSTALGTPVTFANTNEGSFGLALPFAFPFYGQSYTTLYVSPNGYLTTSSNMSPKPDLATTRGIFPLAKDQKVGTGVVTTRQDDLVNPTWVEIRWKVQLQTAGAANTSAYNDFAARLHNDGRITFTYGAMTDSGGARVGYSAGDGWNFGNVGGLDNNNVPWAAPSVEIGGHSATTTTSAYDALDRWTAPGVTYDGAGNTLAADGIAYGYDARNRLVSSTGASQTATFGWDGEARHVKTITDGNERRIRYGAPGDTGGSYETDATNTVMSANLAGPVGLMATYAGTEPTYYFATPRGDIAATMNVNGTVTAMPLYDEYGNQIDGEAGFGFVGTYLKRKDTVSGITLMGARAYHPGLGRFFQRDPVDGGSCNDYEYACGDAINGLDLDGSICWFVFRNKGCKAREAFKNFGKSLKKANAGYNLWKNANSCLNSRGANTNSCLYTFFNGLISSNPFAGSPGYKILLSALGKAWGCSTKTLRGVADVLAGKDGIWIGVGTSCPAFIPKS